MRLMNGFVGDIGYYHSTIVDVNLETGICVSVNGDKPSKRRIHIWTITKDESIPPSYSAEPVFSLDQKAIANTKTEQPIDDEDGDFQLWFAQKRLLVSGGAR